MIEKISPAVRSRMMAGIRTKHTDIEMIVRSYLHARGFRYRLHEQKLPGRPDLALKRWNLAIFVHGCFWHGHADCRKANMPKTRPEFWQEKFRKNSERDKRATNLLHTYGWRTAVVWGCALETNPEETLTQLAKFTKSKETSFEASWRGIFIT